MRGDERRDPTAIDETATDALGALANEHRIAILRVLADADRPLRFSELRERIDMRDTGRFNYHLTELLGRFVQKGEHLVSGGVDRSRCGDGEHTGR